jgi:ATP-dependent helicase HrpA
VLATNVAETSLTVPRIRYVIDTGSRASSATATATRSRCCAWSRSRRARRQQRSGRCGRVATASACGSIRRRISASGPQYTDPELLRSSLASVILRAKSLGLGEVEELPFLDPPSPRAIADGYALLHELDAVDEARQLTDRSDTSSRACRSIRAWRACWSPRARRLPGAVLIIAAALSVQDPARAAAGQGGRGRRAPRRASPTSAPISSASSSCGNAGRPGLRRLCRENFLSYRACASGATSIRSSRRCSRS